MKKYKRLVLYLIAMVAVCNVSAIAQDKKIEQSGKSSLLKTESFDTHQWTSNESSRRYQFKKFLAEYNLIGMKKAKVTELLGNPSKGNLEFLVDYLPTPVKFKDRLVTYFLCHSGTCGRGDKFIQIAFDGNDEVSCWRINGMFMTNDRWFEKNMTFPISDSWSFKKRNFGLIEKG